MDREATNNRRQEHQRTGAPTSEATPRTANQDVTLATRASETRRPERIQEMRQRLEHRIPTTPGYTPEWKISKVATNPEELEALRKEKARGGASVAVDVRVKDQEGLQRADAEKVATERQRRLARVDPLHATMEEARDLGHVAILNRINGLLAFGDHEGAFRSMEAMRANLAFEKVEAVRGKRPVELARLEGLGVAPDGASQVLPSNPEVRIAYVEGLERALNPRSGRSNGHPTAADLIQDSKLTTLFERVRLGGESPILGQEGLRGGNPSPEALRGQGQDSEHQRAIVHYSVELLKTARERHAEAARVRLLTTVEQSEYHRLMDPAALRTPAADPKIEASIQADLLHYLNQEVAPQARKEIEALQPYLEHAVAARRHLEHGGEQGKAKERTDQAMESFRGLMDRGEVSPETVEALRLHGLTPASLQEQVRGVDPSLQEMLWGAKRAKNLMNAVPAGDETRVYLYRAPGSLFQDLKPLAAFQHAGKTHLAFEDRGRVTTVSLEAAKEDPHHPAHSLAYTFEEAARAARDGDHELALPMRQRGFVPVTDDEGRWAPWAADLTRAAPLHLGARRTEAINP